MQSLRTYQLTPSEKKHIMELITSILKDTIVIFAYLHGSFLKESFRDVDLAVYLERPLEKKEAIQFEFEMERELEKVVNFPVDVRILNNSPLSFRYNVIKKGNLLFSKNELVKSDFICLTLSMYHDFNFYRKRYMREALGLEI